MFDLYYLDRGGRNTGAQDYRSQKRLLFLLQFRHRLFQKTSAFIRKPVATTLDTARRTKSQSMPLKRTANSYWLYYRLRENPAL